jgi:hypothetical protein
MPTSILLYFIDQADPPRPSQSIDFDANDNRPGWFWYCKADDRESGPFPSRKHAIADAKRVYGTIEL